MESNYKKIEFGQDGTLVTNEPAVTIEVAEETPAEEVQAPEVAPVTNVQEVQEVQKDVKRRSRAKERIEQLVSKQREVEEILSRKDQELMELRKQLEQNTKMSKEDLKTSLERQVMALSRQLADYTRSGDVDKAVEAQDMLIDAKVKLSNLTSEMANQKRIESVQAESPRANPPAKLPPLAQQWIDEHPEFKTDAIFHAAALVVNNQLVNEGFDHNQEDFWDELSDRLSPRFPEVFGIEQENGVQLSQSKHPSHETTNGQQDVNNQAARAPVQSTAGPKVPPKARTTEQTVSSSSRPASPSIQQPNKGTSVEFTQAEAAQAEAWQIPLETMARRIVHQEKNKRPDGYTEIIIPKKGN